MTTTDARLALSLVSGSIERAETLIESLRQTLDHEDEAMAFRVEHNDLARCHYEPHASGVGQTLVCHCGLGESIRECMIVLDELKQAREQLARLA